MVFKYSFLTALTILLKMSSPLFAQQAFSVSGIVGGTKVPIAGATVSIRSIDAKTDGDGIFYFPSIPTGQHPIRVTAIGYQSYQDTIAVGASLGRLNITLIRETNTVSEVTVIGQTETQRAREQAIRAVVVDTRAAAEQPVTLAELMNRSPGIRIRQSGGLGNQVDVSVNGFQGNSVQYFRDGIPLEYLGGGYGINNVPINQLERVEVYRGVVPINLGGDALGGAVNLVTNKHIGTHLNASYEVASFNTHIANLSFHHTDKKNEKFLGIDAFYNYSDNNYNVDVEVVNENANLVPATVRLFHNGYKHHYAEAYIGLRNKSWADEIKLSVANYGIRRESQHPALMTNPYGAITMKNRGLVPSIRYKKAIFDDKLSFDQFVSYSIVIRNRADTVRGTYDWYGNFIPRNDNRVGESPSPSLSDIDFTNVISRSNMAYRINENHSLESNVLFNYNKRIGSDPYGLRFAGTDIDVLSREAIYQKTIAGISWESKWLDNRLTNQLIGKYFHFKTRGINAFLANDTDLNKYTTFTDNNWGIGEAVKYEINERSFIRASIEFTNRLPREEELFGDNDTRAPNFNLEPEHSLNVNLGYRYATNKYAFEVGTFYRKTRGMILLIPIQPPFSQHQNLDSIRGYGFDLDVSYHILKNFEISGNMTWQDNRMIDIATPLYEWIEGTRLRNTPFFFANLALTSKYQHVIRNNDLFRPYIHYNFIREFYLAHIPRDQEPQGFLGIFGKSGVPVTNLVPDQSLLTAGFNYTLPSGNLVFGAEVKNIMDAKLYDYYKVQRPGRSIHVKINYYIKSIKS